MCETYFAVSDLLALDWLEEQIKELNATTRWQVQAREVFREDLNRQQHLLALSARDTHLANANEDLAPVSSWEHSNELLLQRWQKLTSELQTNAVDSAILTVAMRELQAFSQSSN